MVLCVRSSAPHASPAEFSFPTDENRQSEKTTETDRSSFSFRYLDLDISYKFQIIFAFSQNQEHLIIMHTSLLLVASLTVLLSSASGSPLPEPQPQPLFFRQLGNILQKKIGIINHLWMDLENLQLLYFCVLCTPYNRAGIQ